MSQLPPDLPPELMEPELDFEVEAPNWFEQFWTWVATSGVLVYVVVIFLLLVSLLVGIFLTPILEQLRQVGQ